VLELGSLGRSRIRLIRQNQISECGLASLAMVANYHGLDIDLGTLRRRFGSSLRGSPLRSLIKIADRIGLASRAVKLPVAKLSELQLPAILHWDLNHYVVIERVRQDRALIHNPDGRSHWMDLSDVSNHFTGAALELTPGAGFERASARERLRLSQLWSRITGLKRALLQVIALTIVLQAYVLATPYYMQVAIDTALPALDRDLLSVLVLGFVLFTIINAGASILRSLVFLASGSMVGFSLASNLGRHLFRLPIDWFEKRHTGDILSRFQSILPVQSLLTQGAVGALVDGVLTVFTLALMFWYSVPLTLLALLGLLLYGLVRLFSYSFERSMSETSIIARGKEQTMLIETLRGMTTLRLFANESIRHGLWTAKLADAVNADFRLGRVGIWQTNVNTLIFGIENLLSIWIAVLLVMNGDGFSIGMIFAFLAYKAQFVQRAGALIDQVIQFRMLGLHLERLSDIALTEEDRTFTRNAAGENFLTGALELKNVAYRYGPDDPYVFEEVGLVVETGEHIVITGPSGGGKSTLAKIILGLVEPSHGEVLIDGKPMDGFGLQSYHEQVSAVLQEDSLFAGSIADNIAFFDERVNMRNVMQAARDASIHDEIMAMPMQYETFVGEMGSSVSGGQKQRILIARALYRSPRLLVIDEGTSHLDQEHEKVVNSSIARLGITRIVIAHRRETIDLADRVFVMDSGRLRERTPG
jgi:ATP-binding cassette, subfamily B, bacterial CvaB/MchF/RaxB